MSKEKEFNQDYIKSNTHKDPAKFLALFGLSIALAIRVNFNPASNFKSGGILANQNTTAKAHKGEFII